VWCSPAEGLPLYHEVFNGNTAEVITIKAVIEKIVARFPIKRIIAVADRGLLSTENLLICKKLLCLEATSLNSFWPYWAGATEILLNC
jgi:transposase